MTFKLMSRDKGSALKNISVFYLTALIVTPLAALLRTVAYFTSFDAEIGYFTEGFFNSLINALIIVCSVFFVCGFVFISKEADLPRFVDNGACSIFFSACFAGFVMLADFAYKLVGMVTDDRLAYYRLIFSPNFISEDAYMLRVTSVIEMLGVIASLLAAICFFVRSSRAPRARLSAVMGFFPVIRALVGVAEIYFDMTVQMNHPSKLILQLALIAVMLYFLCEERYYISQEYACPRRSFICGCLAFFLAFVGGSSEVIGFFFGRLSKGELCIEAFFCLVMSFYILARTNSFVKCASAAPNDTVASTEELRAE